MALPQRQLDAPAEPALAELPAVSPQPKLSDAVLLWGLIALAFAVRAAAFPFTQNLYGDAVVRTELAERWLTSPHLITSFNDGVLQFGPLHTYVLAAFLAVWHDREQAGRLASMVFGVLVVWPTWRVAHRLFGRSAAVWSCVAVALWGMHIQMSTTAGSESLALCVFAFAIDGLLQGLEEMRFAPLARAALFLNLACAVRYDMWLYVPLFGVAIAVWGADRIAGVTRSVMFLALASVFPLLWMEGNEKALGDPLYAVHFIDQFHRNWTQDGIKWLGVTRFRLWGLVFWPGTLVLTCSPIYGLLCLLGAGATFVRKQHRLLVVFALIPTLYFTVRTLLLTFSPLARFAVAQVWLCLPFAWLGLQVISKRLPRVAQGIAALAVIGLVATPVAFAKMSYLVDDGWGNTLKPVSPVSTMPADQMEVAHWLRDHVGPPEAVLLDYDDVYTDIGVGFFSNIPEDRLVKLRWEQDPHSKITERIERVAPRVLVMWKGGKLLARPEVVREGDALTAYGLHFRKERGFSSDRYEVFRAP